MFAVAVLPLAMLISVSSWVSQDARRRGMSSRWAVGVGLLFMVFFPLYLLVRKRTVKCTFCGNDIDASRTICGGCEQLIEQDPGQARPGRILE